MISIELGRPDVDGLQSCYFGVIKLLNLFVEYIIFLADSRHILHEQLIIIDTLDVLHLELFIQRLVVLLNQFLILHFDPVSMSMHVLKGMLISLPIEAKLAFQVMQG